MGTSIDILGHVLTGVVAIFTYEWLQKSRRR